MLLEASLYSKKVNRIYLGLILKKLCLFEEGETNRKVTCRQNEDINDCEL